MAVAEPEAGRMTLVAVYENLEQGHAAERDLVGRRLDPQPLLLQRRDDGPEQSVNGMPAVVRPVAEGEEEIGSGVAVGATIGGTVGLLATTWIVPGVGPAMAGVGSLASTVAGAGLGAVLGGWVQRTVHATDGVAPGAQVRLGGVLLLARVAVEQAEAAQRILQRYGPLEVRVL